ncbi:IMP cyclohydrolase [Actinoplanes octamycinicus]|uniref:IMP cyclohydrolase n=1 Tax=Actinoplanes octamycinicus TaxID=135948 RepID=A0A7W7H212_9ACTN|nr:IMP cyclohydrolase [Actinoplanes octamycinicus]MBB4742422.1 IMP cyclohydrolase [Actinoplanes octamycinicus]GIE62329.1 hypothetical protein Aoc01nite_77310 [Actinoplanes octamycinicus]
MSDIGEALTVNRYPGRVLVLARTGDGELTGVYALTGRSPSSKARRIVPGDAELRVEATGEHAHDRLRHYTAAHSDDRWTVFGNGEQVTTVFERLSAGAHPAVALDELDYEPDPPIWTPRITVVVDRRDGTAWLGAARRGGGRRESTDVTVTTLRDLAVGDVALLTTYTSDGTEVTTAPRVLDLTTTAATGDELLDLVWSALDPEFRVAAAQLSPRAGIAAVLRHAP